MEILGDDAEGRGPDDPPGSWSGDPAAAAPLVPAGPAPDVAEEPSPDASSRIHDVILGPEALALAAFTVVLLASVSGLWQSLTITDGLYSPRAQLESFAAGFGISGLLALGLGLAAAARIRGPVPAWVRGCAGASVLLAIVLLALAAYAAVHAPDVPENARGVAVRM